MGSFEYESADDTNEAQKIVAYVMPDRGAKGAPGHKFMVLRRTTKNAKGRYVTAEEFAKFGLFWPSSLAKTREELATLIGEAILDEADIYKRERHLFVTCDYETAARVGAVGTFQVIALTEDGKDVTDLVDLGIHFHDLDTLKRYLERATGDAFELEVEETELPATAGGGVGPWLWDQDSWLYQGATRRAPAGRAWADKAIAARSTSLPKAFTYARNALATDPNAWAAWFAAFSGIPVDGS
jgi:hypothetical protein